MYTHKINIANFDMVAKATLLSYFQDKKWEGKFVYFSYNDKRDSSFMVDNHFYPYIEKNI